jgi:hypothetical protein
VRRLVAAAGLKLSGTLAAWLLLLRRRRGDAAGTKVRVSWSRRRIGGVVRLGCDVDAPPARGAAAGAAVAAAVAEAAAALGLTVGSVGIVPGEEPRLVALAPRRDLIAPAVLEALAWHGGYPPSHLWMALAPGTYLAELVDPYRPFAPGDDVVAELVRSGGVRCALTTDRSGGAGAFRIRLGLYCSPSDLGTLVGFARTGLDGVRGRTAAR